MHWHLGDAVIHVSPGRNWLYVSDAEAVCELFRRSKDFDRPPDLLKMLGVFGENISTVGFCFCCLREWRELMRVGGWCGLATSKKDYVGAV